MDTISNIQPVSDGFGYQPQYRDAAKPKTAKPVVSKQVGCESGVGIAAGRSATTVYPDVEHLTPGDLLTVSIASDETFTGSYEVSQDGTLKLPYIDAISAKGRTVQAVERAIAQELVAEEFYEKAPRISVRVADFAAARVFVSGAVFEPNAVTVGAVSGSDIDRTRQSAIGAVAGSRRLSAALQAAGGVRPDADLKQVILRRAGEVRKIDVRPAMFGRPFNDPILLESDQIEVRSLECFQPELARPSSVTPPGIKVYMSNLSQPADANALAAVSKDTTDLRYGTRFIQAVFGMNCYGGAKLTNANRSAILLSRDPVTGDSIVVERDIEDLLRRSDRDSYNPYLMPYDSIACYDSTVVSVTEVARALGAAATPAVILGISR
ncbi:polysaccharide biosynthesis/export family protein [Acuticoccus sp. MNP-M23]|uniref:polysaccharide biosynthesis/export family protein n=1 Tax=Acuticoccus sp. MNP-M23 TaxID=3072793 RepID=UPI002815350D|nr:polysaccharide biosynthesis/export family protein [Acuticoccus sp. MNP-M23]WMS42794.1 polysaccharide biosynthesis/export family protein [Acuticoccus sp. MNP-M23]